MKDVETLLLRLDGVKSTGPGKWVAKCPAHEDRSPSLAIKDTGTRTLVHCFAGCEAEDVLTAVGLKWQDIIRDEFKAANAAATHRKIKLPDPDPVSYAKRVVILADSDRRAGKDLSVADRITLENALDLLDSVST